MSYQPFPHKPKPHNFVMVKAGEADASGTTTDQTDSSNLSSTCVFDSSDSNEAWLMGQYRINSSFSKSALLSTNKTTSEWSSKSSFWQRASTLNDAAVLSNGYVQSLGSDSRLEELSSDGNQTKEGDETLMDMSGTRRARIMRRDTLSFETSGARGETGDNRPPGRVFDSSASFNKAVGVSPTTEHSLSETAVVLQQESFWSTEETETACEPTELKHSADSTLEQEAAVPDVSLAREAKIFKRAELVASRKVAKQMDKSFVFFDPDEQTDEKEERDPTPDRKQDSDTSGATDTGDPSMCKRLSFEDSSDQQRSSVEEVNDNQNLDGSSGAESYYTVRSSDPLSSERCHRRAEFLEKLKKFNDGKLPNWSTHASAALR